jgi:hypothetical protein
MPFIILDPRSGTRVVVAGTKTRAEQKARNWVFRELDRLAATPKDPARRGEHPR